MNIKLLRKIHLYLGCFFAPLLIFFIVSGCLQTYYLHQSKKDGSYRAPAVLQKMSEVHKHQRWTSQQKIPASSSAFRFLVLLMSVGITATAILGVILAFKYTEARMVWLCLLGGIAAPLLILLMAFIF